MNKILILPLFFLTMCAPAPVTPPAHACSPRLDGKPTHCPSDLDRIKLPRDQVRGEIDIYNPIHWEQFQYMYLRNRRLDRLEKNMTQPNDSVNTAIEEYMQEYK